MLNNEIKIIGYLKNNKKGPIKMFNVDYLFKILI